MGVNRKSTLVLLATALIASAVAGPLDRRGGQCARQCTEGSKFRYDPGTTYTYNYEATTVTTMQGTTREESRLHLRALVEIEAISKCEFSLRLRGVTLEQSDPRNPNARTRAQSHEAFRRQLEQYPIRFSFQDGKIEDVCAPEQEEPWVLNIKRGALSAFQTSMQNLDVAERVIETDVAGRCVAEYESLGRSWKTLSIRRTKDLTTCTDRESAKTVLQATPYTETKATKSQPLVKGSQVCMQTFRHDRLETSECTENHIFRPFSRQTNGAMTTATWKLTFVRQDQGRISGNDYLPTRTGMLFQHEAAAQSDGQKREVEMVLRELCTATADDIRPEVPRLFARLIYKMRDVEYSGLQNIFQGIDTICGNSNGMVRKFFLDALPVVGTTHSVKLMQEMIMRRIISGSQADAWMSALAFIPKPNVEMIDSLTPLLDGNFPDALLHISTLIHTFCRSHGDCGTVLEVQAAVRKIAQILGESCYGRDRRIVLLALKAIGNIGLGSEVSNTLQRCYSNPQNDIEVRLAAIQAFRRFSCDVPRENLLYTYSNFDENTELRIAAYLAAMRCPSAITLHKIQETMEKEPINQVGAYVFSHLMNQENILTPYKKEIKNIVTDLYLLNKFHADIRKFSHNFRKSVFMKSLDSGADIEADLIYSPDSFLPRSGMLNLTFDLFGNSVNLFEIGGRFEGFERYLESMFGPAGYLADNTIYRMLREARRKRSIADNKIEEIEEKFNAKSRFPEEPSGSVYMKLFGNEMFYDTFKGLGIFDRQKETINIIETLLKMLNEKDMEYTKSVMFLDATYVIPLGSGLPLRLAVNGTATVHLSANGKFEVRSFNDVDIKGRIKPSGAIEISSLMTVDAKVAKTGVKMVATLHSSTHLEGLIEIKDGRMARMQMNMPKDKMEVIDIQSRIFLVHSDEEREQIDDKSRTQQVSTCSGAYTSRILGMELCGDLQVPTQKRDSPLFPMNGPAIFRVYLRKTDPTLTTYNFDASWRSDPVARKKFIRHLTVSFNTPQSTMDREITLDFNLNEPEKSLAIKLRTPVQNFGMNAKFNNERTQRRFDLSFTMNDREQFSLQSELRAEFSNGGSRYTPFLEIRIPGRRLIYLKGHASLRTGQKYIGQLSIEDLTEKPIILSANIDLKEKEKIDGEFSLSSTMLDTNIKGYLQTGKNLASKMTLEYRYQDNPLEKFDFTAKFRDLSANSLVKFSGALSLQSTALPEYSTSVNFEIQKTKGYWEKSLEINMGDGVRSRIHTISILEIVSYQFNGPERGNLLFTISMKYPQKNMDYAFTMKHEHGSGSLNDQLTIVYGPGKEFVSLLELALEKSTKLQASGTFKVQYPGREMILSGKVNEVQPKNYEATLTCQWQRGKAMKAVASYTDGSNRNQLNHQMSIELNLPRRKPISMTGSVTGSQNRYAMTGALDMGRDRYSLNVEYNKFSALNHRFYGQMTFPRESYSTEVSIQGGHDLFVANMDMKLGNYRQIAAKTEMKRNPEGGRGSVDVMWDATGDKTKRFNLQAEYKNVASGLQGSFTLNCPCGNTRGSFNTNSQGKLFSRIFRTNSHAELEWGNSQKLSLDFTANSNFQRSRRQFRCELNVQTPFQGYENNAMSIVHSDDGKSWNCLMSASWPRGRKIALASDGRFNFEEYGRYLQGTVKLNTPFQGFEMLRLDLSHEKGPSDFSNKVDFQWANGKTISAGNYVSLYGSEGFRAGMNFSSPFREVREFSSAISYNYEKDNLKVQSEVSLNNQKQMTLDFTGHHELSGRKRMCKTEATIMTMIQGFERVNFDTDYTNDGREVGLRGNFYWNNNRMTGSISGSRVQSSRRQDVNGKIFLETPFRELSRLLITLNHFMDKEKLQTAFDVELNGQKTVAFTAKGSMPSMSEIQGMTTLKTSFQNLDLSAEIDNKIRGKSIASLLILASGTKRITTSLSGFYDSGYNTYSMNGNLAITTPFRNYEEMEVTITNDQKNDRMNTHLTVSVNKQAIIQVVQKSYMQSLSTFEHSLEITTPFNAVRSGRAFLRQIWTDGEYKHNCELEWNREKITLSTVMVNENPRYGHKFSATSELTTTNRALRTLRITCSHYDNTQEFHPQLTIQWNDDSIQFKGYLRLEDMSIVDSKATFTSTIPTYESVIIAAKYNMKAPRKTAELSYSTGSEFNTIFSAKGYLEATLQTGEMKMDINTPWKGMKRNSLFMSYRNQNYEKELVLQTEMDNSKLSLSAQTTIQTDSFEGRITCMTPFSGYEKVTGAISCGYRNDGAYGEISGEKNNDNMISKAEYKMKTDGKFDFKMTFKSTLRGYEDLQLQAIVNAQNPMKKMMNVEYQWAGSKKVELRCDLQVDPANFININMEFRSPFEGYETITMVARFNKERFSSNGLFKLQWNPSKIILAVGNVNFDDSYLRSVTFNLDTPYSPFSSVKFACSINPQNDQLEVNSNLEWEGSKITVDLFARNQAGKSMEGRFAVATPFESFRKLSIDGSLQNNGLQFVDAKVSIITPFAGAENVALSGQFRSTDGYQFNLNMDAPEKTFAITCNLRNNDFNPALFELSIDAPLSRFKMFTVTANLNMENSRVQAGIIATTKWNKHTISGSYQYGGRNMQGELNIDTPLFNAQRMTFRYEIISDYASTMSGSFSMETPKDQHRLVFSMNQNKQEKRGDLTIDSPMMTTGPWKFNVRLNNKLPNKYEAELSAVMFAENHSMKMMMISNNRQSLLQVNIQCPLLSSRPIRMEGKYVNSNDRVKELMISFTSVASHTAKITISSYNNENEIQMNIDSPLLPFKSLTASGNYKSINTEAMEGALSIATPSKELRIAGNLKRNEWKEFDGFATLNTPFENLRMARVDMKFNTNNYQTFDASLNIETSLQAFRSMSAVAKIRRNRALDDISINLKLPFQKYRDLGLLSTMHYNRDSISPKITLTADGERYSLFGNYRHLQNDFYASVGCEWNRGQKVEFTTEAKYRQNNAEARIEVVTPIKGHERYSISGNYNNDRRRITCQAAFEYPNEKFTFRGNLGYSSFPSFDARIDITTPLQGFETLYAFVRQQYTSNMYRLDAEQGWPNAKKIVVNVKNGFNRTHYEGQFIFNSPNDIMREVKASYGYGRDSYNTEGNMDFSYNGRMIFRTEGKNIYQRDTKGFDKTLQLDIPVLPLTISYIFKSLQSGGAIAFKTICPSRTTAFNVNLQRSSNLFRHGMEFNWDERTRSMISYEIRLSDNVRSGKESSELYGRINFPVRSMELKGTQTKTRNGRSINADFFWDAARDVNKRMTFGFEHQDLSTRKLTLHKIQVTGRHPRLTKPITINCEGSVARNEIYGKTEIEYSVDQRHNFLCEGRFKNASPYSGSNYVMEVAVRHPVSNLETTMKGEVINNRNIAAVNIQMDYLDRNRMRRIQELKAKIEKAKQEIDMLMKAGENQIILTGQMFNRDEQFVLVMEHKVNNNFPIHSHLRINAANKNMDLNITTSSDSGLHLRAAFPSDVWVMQMTHTRNGQVHSDASVNVGLVKSRLLRTRINWRPEVIEEFKDIFASNYKEMSNSMNEAMNAVAKEMNEEAISKSRLMSISTNENMSPFYDEVTREINMIQHDYNRAKRSLQQMYNRNELYMKDISEGVTYAVEVTSDALSSFFETIGQGFVTLGNMMEDFSTILSDKIAVVLYEASEMYSRFIQKTIIVIEELQSAVVEMTELALSICLENTIDILNMVFVEFPKEFANFVGENMPFLHNCYEFIIEVQDVVAEKISDMITNMMERIANSPYAKLIATYLEEIGSTFDAFSMDIVTDMLQALYERIINAPNLAEPIVKYYDSLRTHPNVIYLGEVSQKMLDQSFEAFDNLGLSSIFSDILDISFKSIQEAILSLARQMTTEYTSMMSGIRYEVNTPRGFILLDIPLPSERNTLYEAMDVMEYPAVQNFIRAAKAKYIWHDEFSIYDGWYAFKNHMKKYHPFYWVPPFNALAMIGGKQHFMTFDNFYFEFAGECSYLLAHDFVDRNFSIAINYARDGRELVKKSLTILSDGHQIEVSPDYKVSLDNTRVELPLAIGKTTVKREDGTIFVSNNRGFDVQCNFVHDVCTVDMSGFYFGKTGGLFGTYDYEPKLDMMTPERTLVESITDFANSWEIGNAVCRRTRNFADTMSNSIEAEERCKSLFTKYDSIFRPCFKQVPTAPFMTMCLNDLSTVSENKFDEKICTSAYAYRAQCNSVGVSLRMPKSCVRCEKHDGNMMNEGDMITVTKADSVQSADVVYIVEEKACNSETARMLSKLARGIEDNFQASAINSIRHAVVGFGGSGVHADPHVHTADGQIFGGIRFVDSAFNSLTTGDGPNNILEALRYAATLPFRAGASRTFVLLKCSACQAEEVRADYNEVLRTLLDGDITLHILMDHEFMLKTKKPSAAKQVFGLDKQYAYTAKYLKDLRGDSDLLLQTRIPKDFCVPLAMEVNGTIFSSNKLTETKRNTYKRFIDIFGQRLTQHAGPSECQICECIATDEGVGKSACQRCVSRVVSQTFSPDFTGEIAGQDDFFEDTLRVPKRPSTRKLRKQKKKQQQQQQ